MDKVRFIVAELGVFILSRESLHWLLACLSNVSCYYSFIASEYASPHPIFSQYSLLLFFLNFGVKAELEF